MTLFQRLFRKATAQPALPSDVLVGLLYSKLLALPMEEVEFSREFSIVHARFRVQLRADRWVNFGVHIHDYGDGEFISGPTVMTGSSRGFKHREALTVAQLPVTLTVKLLVEALIRIRDTRQAMAVADAEANAQLAALDIVNEVLGLPAPEEQLALGQEYPRAEAVTVARPTPPQAKELRK